MIVSYHIFKKRGFHRPMLSIRITLSGAEADLSPLVPKFDTGIPQPSKKYSKYPDSKMSRTEREHYLKERNDEGERTWVADISFYNNRWEEKLYLPIRESNEYPEVIEGIHKIRNAVKEALIKAYKSAPIDVKGELDFDPQNEEEREFIAYVAAEKL